MQAHTALLFPRVRRVAASLSFTITQQTKRSTVLTPCVSRDPPICGMQSLWAAPILTNIVTAKTDEKGAVDVREKARMHACARIHVHIQVLGSLPFNAAVVGSGGPGHARMWSTHFKTRSAADESQMQPQRHCSHFRQVDRAFNPHGCGFDLGLRLTDQVQLQGGRHPPWRLQLQGACQDSHQMLDFEV